VPVALTAKVAVWPAATLWLAGCVVMAGAVEAGGGVDEVEWLVESDVLPPQAARKMQETAAAHPMCLIILVTGSLNMPLNRMPRPSQHLRELTLRGRYLTCSNK
jgi:hypothetical protein